MENGIHIECGVVTGDPIRPSYFQISLNTVITQYFKYTDKERGGGETISRRKFWRILSYPQPTLHHNQPKLSLMTPQMKRLDYLTQIDRNKIFSSKKNIRKTCLTKRRLSLFALKGFVLIVCKDNETTNSINFHIKMFFMYVVSGGAQHKDFQPQTKRTLISSNNTKKKYFYRFFTRQLKRHTIFDYCSVSIKHIMMH